MRNFIKIKVNHVLRCAPCFVREKERQKKFKVIWSVKICNRCVSPHTQIRVVCPIFTTVNEVLNVKNNAAASATLCATSCQHSDTFFHFCYEQHDRSNEHLRSDSPAPPSMQPHESFIATRAFRAATHIRPITIVSYTLQHTRCNGRWNVQPLAITRCKLHRRPLICIYTLSLAFQRKSCGCPIALGSKVKYLLPCSALFGIVLQSLRRKFETLTSWCHFSWCVFLLESWITLTTRKMWRIKFTRSRLCCPEKVLQKYVHGLLLALW